MVITLDEMHRTAAANGGKVTDYTAGRLAPPCKYNLGHYPGPRPNKGYIELQNHSNDIVFFTEVTVRPLPQ